ncbi:hypothetical protein IWW48_003081 [Coemansia sp. RSA 1200]|nr:hypothetical protein IWW48_003081 [Coemansia sp. RSA 1200]
MFTSPSVRVKRRQPPPQAPDALRIVTLKKDSSIKRLAVPTDDTRFAAVGKALPSSKDDTQTPHSRTSPRKRHAGKNNHLGWQSHTNIQQTDAIVGRSPQIVVAEEYGRNNDATDGRTSVAGSGDSVLVSDNPSCSGGFIEFPSDGPHTLLRNDKHSVLEVSSFPDTVHKLLGSIDLRSVPLTAGLSSDSGFAFVATPTTCLVWSYSHLESSMDDTYKLTMPDPQNAEIYEAPVAALVAAGEKQNDVGLISCSATGEIRYWDSVVFGLGGADRFHSRHLELFDSTDRCIRIKEVYPGIFVIATRRGALYQVSLHNSHGAVEMEVRLLSKSTSARGGVLGRVSSLLGGGVYSSNVATTVDARDALVSLAGGGRTEVRHSREVFILSREKLSKWIVSRSQPERFVYSLDIMNALGNIASQKVSSDAEMITYDVAVARGGIICLLLGLKVPQRPDEAQMAIAVLRSDHVLNEPNVLGLWPLNHIWTEPLGQDGASRPQLVLPERGPTMYIVSRKTIVVTVVPTLGIVFEEHILFRDDDFVLGTSGINSGSSRSLQESPESNLAISCIGAGVLNLSVYTGKIFSLAASSDNPRHEIDSEYTMPTPAPMAGWPDPQIRVGTPSGIDNTEQRFKNQIEQAVFFGIDNSRNPLSFAIVSQNSGVDAALEHATLRVSQSILNSTSHFVANRLDLGTHLKERLHRARLVMQFISDNELVDKLSIGTRKQLCTHAEKLAAANALWEYQNDVWIKKLGPASQLLSNLVTSFLESMGLQSKDPLRVFFKHHVASIGEMLVFMHRKLAIVRKALENSNSGIRDSQLIAYEANRIVVAALQSSFTFRFQNAYLYHIVSDNISSDSLPDFDNHEAIETEDWTEHPVIIDLLLERLEGTYRLCRDISGQHCSAIHERIEKTTLPGVDFVGSKEQSQSISIFDDAVSVSHATSDDDTNSTKQEIRDADDNIESRLETDDPYKSSLALLYAFINQMGPLANLCFRMFVDRITFLHKTSPNDAISLSHRYEAIRPRYLLCLVPIGRAPIAFRLAEEYRDLASLVILVFTTDLPNAAEHIQNYVSRFGKEFADILFTYYEQRQAWASLLYTQDDNFDAWLKQFIDERTTEDPNGFMPQVGWVHDVKMCDFVAAAAKLTRAGRDSDEVEQARIMLSLGKLAFAIVESQEAVQSDTVAKAHTRLEDALEMCEVQESLMGYFTVLVKEKNENPHGQVWRHRDDINDRKASLNAAMLTTTPECRHSYPALYIIYGELVRRIWNGTTLNVENLIDVLTYPDNVSAVGGGSKSSNLEFTEKYNQLVHDRCALALDILSRSSFNIPEVTREAMLRTIWRRAYLSDNWQEVDKKLGGNIPDSILRAELLNTSLYKILKSCIAIRELAHPAWYLLPADVFALADTDYLVSARLGFQFSPDPSVPAKWQPLSTVTSATLAKDYAEEDIRLRAAIKSGLGRYYDEIKRIVIDEVSKSDDVAAASFSESYHARNEANNIWPLDSKHMENGDDDVAMDSD